MRLATFNVENLFSRAAALSGETWADGRTILADIDKLARRLTAAEYSAGDKRVICRVLNDYGFASSSGPRPFEVVQAREKLFAVDGKTGQIRVVARGRADWVGWIALNRAPVAPGAISMTGRVIDAIGADVLCLVEVEDRLTLDRFNQQVLGGQYGRAYPHDMCVDGNDARGIDVGILSRPRIVSVRPHIHDRDDEGRIFSRDCAEYELETFGDGNLVVLVNHFKSKGYGDAGESARRRHRQAMRVARLYREALKRTPNVAIVGDLNDIPDSAALSPLLKQRGLRDVSTHPLWTGPTGTFGTGRSKSSKIDYILLSPALWDRVESVGVVRNGVYAPSTGEMWPEVTRTTAASDHAALWVELTE